MSSPSEKCAALVLETTPLVMRTIRNELRKNRSLDLSVPQFRTLAFLGRNKSASLSQLAEHVGTSLPSASKLVDRLVLLKYADRKTQADDRRQIQITLTQSGAQILENVRSAARRELTLKLTTLSKVQLRQITDTMQIIKTLFACEPKKCQK